MTHNFICEQRICYSSKFKLDFLNILCALVVGFTDKIDVVRCIVYIEQLKTTLKILNLALLAGDIIHKMMLLI